MRSRQGDPSGKRQDDREAPTMAALFDRYCSEHARPNKEASSLAEIWGWRPDALNPCRHVKNFAETKCRRFLSPKELARLGEVLRIAERDKALVLPVKEGVRNKARRIPISAVAAHGGSRATSPDGILEKTKTK